MLRWLFLGFFASLASCTRERGAEKNIAAVPSETKGSPSVTAAPAPAPAPTPTSTDELPAYLAHLEKDGDLYARVGATIVDAPAADIAVLRAYPRFLGKGPLTPKGERLTLLTAKTSYLASEEIRLSERFSGSSARRALGAA